MMLKLKVETIEFQENEGFVFKDMYIFSLEGIN